MKDFKDTFFYTKKASSARGKLIDWSNPMVMAILNTTPDSFFDGGKNNSVEQALIKAGEMIAAGADIIDIGGYSSRPNALDISIEEEISRVEPVICALRERYPDVLLSIDTFRSVVAQKAIDCGIDMVNDISGGKADAHMFAVVAKAQIPYCMMHMKGTPQTMLHETKYNNLVGDIIDFFIQQITLARAKGIRDIILDPGLGFAKTPAQNFELLSRLPVFKILGLPVLIGISRKSMIYKTLKIEPADALNGTTVLNTTALLKGANILRVHDVAEAKQAIILLNKLSFSLSV